MSKEYFWQMTFGEFRDYHFEKNPDSNPFTVEDGWIHQITTALMDNRPVPMEVLESHKELCFIHLNGLYRAAPRARILEEAMVVVTESTRDCVLDLVNYCSDSREWEDWVENERTKDHVLHSAAVVQSRILGDNSLQKEIDEELKGI